MLIIKTVIYNSYFYVRITFSYIPCISSLNFNQIP